MKKIVCLLAVLMIMPCVQNARGAKPAFVNLADSTEVYKALYANTPIEPAFMLMPKFAIVGADGKFVFGTGASLKFVATYDYGNPVKGANGMGLSSISSAGDGDRALFQMSAGQSGIFFNIIGFPNTANQIGLFISIGLDAAGDNSYMLGAGQVYMRYRDLQCGYATSLYNDREADAYTIDAHGPCSSGAHNSIGINWQHNLKHNFRIGVGIEHPNVSYTQIDAVSLSVNDANLSKEAHQNIPDIPAYLDWRWGGGHVRLSAIYRNIHYVDLITAQSHNKGGWGLKLTGNAQLDPVKLYWMAQYGQGVASFFRDNTGAGLDLVPDARELGRLTTTRSWGCIAAAQYNISSKIFATAQFSYMRNFIPRYEVASTTDYNSQMRRGYTLTGNLIWKINSLFSTGLEYRFGRRTDETHTSLSNNRLYAMFMMSF